MIGKRAARFASERAGLVWIVAALGAGIRLRWPRVYTPRVDGYRAPRRAQRLGPVVSGLHARPPPPSARAPRSWHARVAGRSSPPTHRDRAAERRAQRAASPRSLRGRRGQR